MRDAVNYRRFHSYLALIKRKHVEFISDGTGRWLTLIAFKTFQKVCAALHTASERACDFGLAIFLRVTRRLCFLTASYSI